MLRDKLSRFNKDINTPENSNINESEFDRYQVASRLLGGEIKRLSAGSFLKIETDFDTGYRHGNLTINQLSNFDPCQFRHFSFNGSDDRVDPEKLLFFDMETTGLGGSGTVAFLIGFGSIIGDNFQVRQYFLPDYSDEAAMLEAVREEIDSETIIVSYNGRSFDMPILTDRLIINRVERNLEFAEHIDLLHSTRRLYRRRLGSCTLSNIERHILEFIRDDDIPGELVPAVYFDWLNNMNTGLLKKVIEHNLYDIVSLYFLMYQIGQTQIYPKERLVESDDIYSVARIYENRREFDKVRETLNDFRPIIEADNRYDMMFMHSLACKRIERFDEAEAIWKELIGSSNDKTYPALIELAKYNEHKTKNLRLALEYSKIARAICPARESDQSDIGKRITRLHKKISG